MKIMEGVHKYPPEQGVTESEALVKGMVDKRRSLPAKAPRFTHGHSQALAVAHE
jgi:hypothetical protein